MCDVKYVIEKWKKKTKMKIRKRIEGDEQERTGEMTGTEGTE
jgi:hypothetical protein